MTSSPIPAAPDVPTPAPSAAKAWVRALEMTARIDAAPSRTFPRVIEELAERFGDAPALLSDLESFSYRQLAARARRYGRWALAQGLAPGDVAALMMPNRPEYMAIWVGLASVGVVTALINTHLTGPALAHALGVARPARIIVDAGLAATVEAALGLAAMGETGADEQIWLHGPGGAPERRIDTAIEALSDAPLSNQERPPVVLRDRALLIYTSGTTGRPKAANVSHHRVMMWSHWFSGMMDTGPGDRLYNCLPLYHSVGGVVATGAVLAAGGSVVLRERFSASQFWGDIVRWDCTLFQYIGELCRYLLAAPPDPGETRHRLRLICGNGLRPDVWTPFQARFAIPRILEFYAATEGNFSLYNAEGHPGAIGRIPPFLAHRFPAAIVRFDPATGLPARDDGGFCIRCPRGEVGEAIGKIGVDPAHPAAHFEGYTNPADTAKKVLRDVFAAGDAWLRTGDLMRMDDKGFYYFVDRIGDTFRWKGENVATTEVSEAICAYPGVQAANVYGAGVPGADGRAGMAALVVDAGFDLAGLRAHLEARLPPYAQPVFLRIVDDLAATETFKQKKQDLVDQGFDPGVIADPLHVAISGGQGYSPLDPDVFAAIIAGRLRL